MNWRAFLIPLKYFAGAIVTITLLSGLVWFATTHWAICLILILSYVIFEIMRPSEKEL